MALTTFMAQDYQGLYENFKSFLCDATISVAPTFSNRVTNHPVDRTSNISDHVISSNPIIRVEGVVSNSYSPQDYENNPGLVREGNLIDYNSNRVETAYKLLKALWEEKSFFQLVSEYDVYDGCILSSFSTSFTKDTSEALVFTIEAEQVRIADHQRVEITFLDGVLQTDAEGNKPGNSPKTAASREFITDDTIADIMTGTASPNRVEE